MDSQRTSVIRTYGRVKTTTSTASCLFQPLETPQSGWRSSSPPSSSLITPPSSPGPSRHARSVLFTPPSDDPREYPCSSPTREPTSEKPQPGLTVDAKPVQATLHGFFTRSGPPKRKRPLEPSRTVPLPAKPHTKSIQMHLTHLPLLHTCKECQMSYVKGGEDEPVHSKHHARVVKGIVWDGLGRGKGKSKATDGGWRVVEDHVSFGPKSASKGRIIMCEGSWGGTKLDEILRVVDTVLSAPALPPVTLDNCKIFLFVTASSPPANKRLRPSLTTHETRPKERIVGVVVSQRIKWAMRVLRDGELDHDKAGVVDSGGGVFCEPTPLPTPLGIHRLFTVPLYRRLGIGEHLLDAAAKHTVYACTFNPTKGEAAFSQPTESGQRAMMRWGKGAVRVFADDESQS